MPEKRTQPFAGWSDQDVAGYFERHYPEQFQDTPRSGRQRRQVELREKIRSGQIQGLTFGLPDKFPWTEAVRPRGSRRTRNR